MSAETWYPVHWETVVRPAEGDPTVGGRMFGKGSFSADIGILGAWFFFILSASLLPIGRRKLPHLVNELLRRGIVDAEILDFNPRKRPLGPLLRLLEWLSRMDGRRGMIWFSLMLADQIVVYWTVLLGDGTPRWIKADAVPGSLFYFLAVGGEQPNLAGLWAFLVTGPVILYLMMVVARLLLLFACLCAHIAANKGLNIVPCHPDGIGGLGLIGKTALFLSLFTFTLGVDLAGLTVNELVINRVFPAPTDPATSNLTVLLVLWVLYFVVGTLLFFAPLAPLRRRMAEAKSNYLRSALSLYSREESPCRSPNGRSSSGRLTGDGCTRSIDPHCRRNDRVAI